MGVKRRSIRILEKVNILSPNLLLDRLKKKRALLTSRENKWDLKVIVDQIQWPADRNISKWRKFRINKSINKL